jgi:hypothetical protein
MSHLFHKILYDEDWKTGGDRDGDEKSTRSRRDNCLAWNMYTQIGFVHMPYTSNRQNMFQMYRTDFDLRQRAETPDTNRATTVQITRRQSDDYCYEIKHFFE